MKIFAFATLALLLLSGCWDDGKSRSSSEYMSTLTKCDDCKLKKPFLGGGTDDADGR